MNSQHRILWEERKLGILNNKPYDDIALEFVPSETDPEVRIPVRVAYFKKMFPREAMEGGGEDGVEIRVSMLGLPYKVSQTEGLKKNVFFRGG